MKTEKCASFYNLSKEQIQEHTKQPLQQTQSEVSKLAIQEQNNTTTASTTTAISTTNNTNNNNNANSDSILAREGNGNESTISVRSGFYGGPIFLPFVKEGM
jgi:hypothetical protein